MDRTSEEDDGRRVGGATGEEGGERDRGAAARAALGRGVDRGTRSGVGGLAEDAWEEAWGRGTI